MLKKFNTYSFLFSALSFGHILLVTGGEYCRNNASEGVCGNTQLIVMGALISIAFILAVIGFVRRENRGVSLFLMILPFLFPLAIYLLINQFGGIVR